MKSARYLRALAIPCTLAFLAAAPARLPQRWAVIVGINDYIEFTDEVGGDLLGAENDARSMRDVLTRKYNFPEENVRLLLSRDATKAAIRDALTKWLPEHAQPQDLVVFYFAGHGSRVEDDNGDEDDGIDETICPADVLRNSTQNDIRDDDLGSWTAMSPSKNVIVILDSCHSGTATRSLSGVRQRSLKRLLRGKTAAVAQPTVAGMTIKSVDESPLLEIAAASPEQSAMDASFPAPGGTVIHGGAFTTYLVKKLWLAPKNATWRDLFVNTVSALKTDQFTQDPQLFGPGDLHLFAPATSVAAQRPAVENVPAGTQAAAQASAVTASAAAPPPPAATSSTVAVPPTAQPPVTLPSTGASNTPPAAASSADTPPASAAVDSASSPEPSVVTVTGKAAGVVTLNGGAAQGFTASSILQLSNGALVRIVSVTSNASRASVVRGVAAVGDTATLLDVALPDMDLVVNIEHATVGFARMLRTSLANEPRIKLSTTTTTARLYLVEDSGFVSLLGRDGALRQRFPRNAQSLNHVRSALDHELAVLRLVNLDNPAASFRVDLDLYQGKREFAINDSIGFIVKSERAGYLTLIDLAADGTMNVLYPNEPGDAGHIPAGREIRVPGEGLNYFVISPPAGMGIVRAIVTEEPLKIDLGSIPTAEASAAAADKIRLQLDGGAGTRGIQVTRRSAGAQAWSTNIVVYVIKP
jgi:hypothetical protein